MAQQRIPAHIAGGRRSPFPKGVFVGTLNKVEDRWSDDKTDMALNLTFNNITPIDGPQVGSRHKFQRLQVIFDGQSLVEIEDWTEGKVPLALVDAAGLVTMLEEALGFALRNAGGENVADNEQFLEQLMAGVYNGRAVGFEVQNRTWKSKKTGKSGIDDSCIRFFAFDDGSGQTAAPAAPAPESPAPAPAEGLAAASPAAALKGLRTRN